MKVKNKIIIITAPSGSGKSTIIKYLLEKYKNLELSISATTRQARINEKNGREYYFISLEEYKKKIKNDEFVEWEEVYKDIFYGTLSTEVERIWRANKIAVFDIDVKGAIALQKKFPENSTSIFIKTKSIEVLEERLINRKTENKEQINLRISKAKQELESEKMFDFTIINDELEDAKKQISEILDRTHQ